MKKADLEKSLGKKIAGRMQQEVHSDRYGTASGTVFDKKEQRERDKAAGLVPFAVKLPQELVARLQLLAQSRELSLNDLTAELLGGATAPEASPSPEEKATKRTTATKPTTAAAKPEPVTKTPAAIEGTAATKPSAATRTRAKKP